MQSVPKISWSFNQTVNALLRSRSFVQAPFIFIFPWIRTLEINCRHNGNKSDKKKHFRMQTIILTWYLHCISSIIYLFDSQYNIGTSSVNPFKFSFTFYCLSCAVNIFLENRDKWNVRDSINRTANKPIFLCTKWL